MERMKLCNLQRVIYGTKDGALTSAERRLFLGGVLPGNVQTRILCNQDSAVVSLVAS